VLADKDNDIILIVSMERMQYHWIWILYPRTFLIHALY